MTIGKKIILISSASVALSTAVATLVQSITIRSQAIETTENTMRSAVIAAESMRGSMAGLRARKSFDDAKILAEVKTASDYRQTRLYDTIPVVAAWKSLEQVARQKVSNSAYRSARRAIPRTSRDRRKPRSSITSKSRGRTNTS